MACGSKELDLPLSRFPLRGQAGAGRVPPTPEARCAPAKSAGTHRCCRLPPQEGCRPLVYPPLSSVPDLGAAAGTETGLAAYEGDTLTQIS